MTTYHPFFARMFPNAKNNTIFFFRIEFIWSVNKVEKGWAMGNAHLACNKRKH